MKVYVSNYLSKSISIIDYDTLTLEKEIKLDENIYPHHFCIDKDKGKCIYQVLVMVSYMF